MCFNVCKKNYKLHKPTKMTPLKSIQSFYNLRNPRSLGESHAVS